jgi:hypothetical protein
LRVRHFRTAQLAHNSRRFFSQHTRRAQSHRFEFAICAHVPHTARIRPRSTSRANRFLVGSLLLLLLLLPWFTEDEK